VEREGGRVSGWRDGTGYRWADDHTPPKRTDWPGFVAGGAAAFAVGYLIARLVMWVLR
jgi:hypothetical protein